MAPSPPASTPSSSTTPDETTLTVESVDQSTTALQASAAAATAASDLPALRTRLDALRTNVRHGSDMWAAYDVYRAQRALTDAATAVDAARRRLGPTRAFRFGARKVVHGDTSNTDDDQQSSIMTSQAGPTACARVDKTTGMTKDTGVHAHSATGHTVDVATATRTPDGVVHVVPDGRDVVLSDSSAACGSGLWDGERAVVMVEVDGGAAAVRLIGLIGVSVRVRDVQGPVWMSECQGCVVRATARQVRVHDCADCALFVRVVGAPIIERCSRLRVGGWMKEDGLAEGVQEGRWRDVVDMSWLREGSSANWREDVDDGDEALFRRLAVARAGTDEVRAQV